MQGFRMERRNDYELGSVPKIAPIVKSVQAQEVSPSECQILCGHISMNNYKVVVVGAGGVGKSSITALFVHDHLDSYRKSIVIDDRQALLDILDTAGQDEHSTIRVRRNSYTEAAQGFVLVYSITSRSTFDEISIFRDQICSLKNSEDVPMILVGNKSDLKNQREVLTDEGTRLAKSWRVPFLESSARLRENINEMFCVVVREIRAQEDLAVPTNNNKKNGGKSLTKCLIL